MAKTSKKSAAGEELSPEETLNHDLNDVSNVDLESLGEFEGKKIVSVGAISISDDAPATRRCLLEDGSWANVPVEVINNATA